MITPAQATELSLLIKKYSDESERYGSYNGQFGSGKTFEEARMELTKFIIGITEYE